MSAKKAPAGGFEKSMKKLETIVEELEKGDFTLEESIAKFEEGLALGKHCRELLDTAEKKIKILTEADDGSVTESEAGGALNG